MKRGLDGRFIKKPKPINVEKFVKLAESDRKSFEEEEKYCERLVIEELLKGMRKYER